MTKNAALICTIEEVMTLICQIPLTVYEIEVSSSVVVVMVATCIPTNVWLSQT